LCQGGGIVVSIIRKVVIGVFRAGVRVLFVIWIKIGVIIIVRVSEYVIEVIAITVGESEASVGSSSASKRVYAVLDFGRHGKHGPGGPVE
jgi:hypothetical protein